jgi:hypothetical protein
VEEQDRVAIPKPLVWLHFTAGAALVALLGWGTVTELAEYHWLKATMLILAVALGGGMWYGYGIRMLEGDRAAAFQLQWRAARASIGVPIMLLFLIALVCMSNGSDPSHIQRVLLELRWLPVMLAPFAIEAMWLGRILNMGVVEAMFPPYKPRR